MIEFKIASEVEEIYPVEDRLLAEARQRDFDQGAIFTLRLALDEACINAIRHGNRADPSKQVHIQVEFSDHSVAVTVEDEGPGFDPGRLLDPCADENLGQPNGRGIFLIRQFCDEVSFNERRNAITFRVGWRQTRKLEELPSLA